MTKARLRWPISAFGLEVHGSEPLFPGLPASAAGHRVDVERVAAAALPALDEGAVPGESERHLEIHGFRMSLVDDGAYLLDAPGVAKVRVSGDGQRIVCATDGTDARWPLLVLAQGLPLAATLRGMETLHAAAVRLPDGRCIGLTAPSGTGKTSVAAELLLAGGTLVCDDVLALEPTADGLRAHPGPAWMSLSADRETALGAAARMLGPVRWMGGKAFHSLPELAGPLRLDALYVLERGRSDQGSVQPLQPSLPELLSLVFVGVVDEPERRVRQLDILARLGREVPIRKVRSPPSWSASDTAAAILAA